jgi:predicted outer membrane repeat protein
VLAKPVIMSDIDSSRAYIGNEMGDFDEKSAYASRVYIPISPHASQIAQGLVQVSITAATWPNITITSATCDVGLSTFDAASEISFSSNTTIEATIHGSAISCTVVVPYYWSVSSLNGNINVGYSITSLRRMVQWS